MSAVNLEFDDDGRILAVDNGKRAHVGTITRDAAQPDGNGGWTAYLFAQADVPGEFGRLDGKLVALRHGQDVTECRRRVIRRLADGQWWTAVDTETTARLLARGFNQHIRDHGPDGDAAVAYEDGSLIVRRGGILYAFRPEILPAHPTEDKEV